MVEKAKKKTAVRYRVVEAIFLLWNWESEIYARKGVYREEAI